MKSRMKQTGAQRLMTVQQAAVYLAISERHLWTITQAGGLRSIKLGRSVRYDSIELDRYIAARLAEQGRN